MNRPTWTEYFLSIAHLVADRSNCIRRQIGAVIVKDGRIAATGYNGTVKGQLNCFEGGCPRCASDIPSGEGLDNCLCVHAEANAVAQAAQSSVSIFGGEIYLTHLPCFTCSKTLVATGIIKVYYVNDYPNKQGIDYLNSCGVEVIKV